LLDEAEKAHPDIFNTFLQVLDEGRLTDAKGRTVDFRHTYIIMTSNSKDIKSFFKPEFMNRLDHVVQFLPLDLQSLAAIAKFHIAELAVMVLEEHDVALMVTDAAAKAIVEANAGDVAEYGARPLRRFVEQRVATDLAHLVLSKDVRLKRSRKLTLDYFGPTGLHFRIDEPQPGARRDDDDDSEDADEEAPVRLHNRREL
jgi:ATP-dependent Clp protease ATP-binding subunit ClpA